MLAGVMTARVRIGLGMTVGDDPATVDPADRPVTADAEGTLRYSGAIDDDPRCS